MKKILKAFTLIELIIVISIITITSSAGVFYFIDFVKSQELTQKIELINDNLNNLDQQIEKYNIFDYSLNFSTNTGSLSYVTYKNIFDSQFKQVLDFGSNNYTGTIKIGGINTNTGILKLYKKEKLFLNKQINGGENINFNFNEYDKYKMIGTLSGTILNDIELNYFSQDNLNLDKNTELKLVEMNTEEDKNGTNITSLKIENIGGKKKIGTNLDKIYLFFELNGIQKFIKITK